MNFDSYDLGGVLEPREAPKAELASYLERSDRLGPTAAGMLAGAIGGAVLLTVATRVAMRTGGPDLMLRLGSFVARGLLLHPWVHVAGLVVAALAGAVVGGMFARITRRLRRVLPLLVWSLVFFPSLWTLIFALVLPRVAPHLRAGLPFVPMLLGVVAYAVVFVLEAPLRVRADETERLRRLVPDLTSD